MLHKIRSIGQSLDEYWVLSDRILLLHLSAKNSRGKRQQEKELERLLQYGITHVLRVDNKSHFGLEQLEHAGIRVSQADIHSGATPSLEGLIAMITFLAQVFHTLTNRVAITHSSSGRRTAGLVTAAFLTFIGKMNVDDAVDAVREYSAECTTKQSKDILEGFRFFLHRNTTLKDHMLAARLFPAPTIITTWLYLKTLYAHNRDYPLMQKRGKVVDFNTQIAYDRIIDEAVVTLEDLKTTSVSFVYQPESCEVEDDTWANARPGAGLGAVAGAPQEASVPATETNMHVAEIGHELEDLPLISILKRVGKGFEELHVPGIVYRLFKEISLSGVSRDMFVTCGGDRSAMLCATHVHRHSMLRCAPSIYVGDRLAFPFLLADLLRNMPFPLIPHAVVPEALRVAENEEECERIVRTRCASRARDLVLFIASECCTIAQSSAIPSASVAHLATFFAPCLFRLRLAMPAGSEEQTGSTAFGDGSEVTLLHPPASLARAIQFVISLIRRRSDCGRARSVGEAAPQPAHRA